MPVGHLWPGNRQLPTQARTNGLSQDCLAGNKGPCQSGGAVEGIKGSDFGHGCGVTQLWFLEATASL